VWRRSRRCGNRIAPWPSGLLLSSKKVRQPSLRDSGRDARVCARTTRSSASPSGAKFKTRYATFGSATRPTRRRQQRRPCSSGAVNPFSAYASPLLLRRGWPVAEAERRDSSELAPELEEADDLVVLGIRGHPVPESRSEAGALSFDSMSRLHGAIRSRISRSSPARHSLSSLLAFISRRGPYRGSLLVLNAWRSCCSRWCAGGLLRALLNRFMEFDSSFQSLVFFHEFIPRVLNQLRWTLVVGIAPTVRATFSSSNAFSSNLLAHINRFKFLKTPREAVKNVQVSNCLLLDRESKGRRSCSGWVILVLGWCLDCFSVVERLDMC